MSADDQAFLDVLSSVPNDVKRYSENIANYVESHIDRVSSSLRESISSSPWIPQSVKPPLPPSKSLPAKLAPVSLYHRAEQWVARNKWLTGAIILSVGAGSYYMYQRSKGRKRRARRAANGARYETVVIAGSMSDPITKSLALDLEKRGFIVYVVCTSIEEEVQVTNQSRPDIRPLMIDVVDPQGASIAIDRFRDQLQKAHHAFPGARPTYLALRSLIIIPSLTYPSAPIATLAPSVYSDLLNARLLQPMVLLQAFLPLLTSISLRHASNSQLFRQSPPNILVLSPGIISSLTPAFHAPESAVVSALDAFTTSLRNELSGVGIPVYQFKLGTFDCSAHLNKQLLQAHGPRAEMLTWPESARHAYGKNYFNQADKGIGGTKGCGQAGAVGRGSSLRELHYAVFDAIRGNGRGKKVRRIGQGSGVYGFIGAWVPGGLVGWMMGMRRVEVFNDGGADLRAIEDSPGSGSGSDNGITGDSEYISVYGNREESMV